MPTTTFSNESESKPRTDAEDKLWQELRIGEAATTADLAAKAGIGKSTAQKILVRWEDDGSVTRYTSDERRIPDRWQIKAAAIEAADSVAPSGMDTATDETPTETPICDPAVAAERSDDVPAGTPGRLAPGALRGMVEDYLTDHPGESFGPTAIAKALVHSSGAVNNALENLVAQGVAVRTQDKPKRFAIKPK